MERDYIEKTYLLAAAGCPELNTIRNVFIAEDETLRLKMEVVLLATQLRTLRSLEINKPVELAPCK